MYWGFKRGIGVIVVCTLSNPVWAGGAINNQNFSSDYIRTLNRNAATDAADVVFYNPGAVTKLREGLTFKGDLHYITKDYENNITASAPLAPLGGDGDLEQDKASIVPGLFIAYNKNDWAYFFGIANVAGGGTVEYEQGNWTSYQAAVGALTALATLPPAFGGPLTFEQITSHELDAKSLAPEYRFGVGYAINDQFSVSAGLRYVDFMREADGRVVLTDLNGDLGGISTTGRIGFEEKGDGIGGFFGFTYTPDDNLTVGLRYETEVSIEVEQEVTASSIDLNPALSVVTDGILAAVDVVDGAKLDSNLPALLGTGLGYQLTEKFRMDVNYMLYFDSDADLGLQRYSKIGDSSEIGFSAEYSISDTFKISGGYLRTRKDFGTEFLLAERPELNANSVSIGFLWTAMPEMDVSFGIAKINYDSEDYTDPATGANVEFGKDSIAFGLGLSYTL